MSASVPKSPVGSTLNMIQKCDAKRPCTTCVLAKCTSECIYEDEKHPRSASTRLSNSANRDLSGRQPGDADSAETTPSPIDGASADVLPPAKLKLKWSVIDSTQPATDEPGPSQPQVPRSCSPGSIIVHRRPPDQHTSQDTSPYIAILPFLPSTIPPEPWIPLSFLGEENLKVQVSDIDATDLDMRSCVLDHGSVNHKLTPN